MNTPRTLRKAIAGLLKQTAANTPTASSSANQGNTEYSESTENKQEINFRAFRDPNLLSGSTAPSMFCVRNRAQI